VQGKASNLIVKKYQKPEPPRIKVEKEDTDSAIVHPKINFILKSMRVSELYFMVRNSWSGTRLIIPNTKFREAILIFGTNSSTNS